MGLVGEKKTRKNAVLKTLALDLAASSHTQFAHRSYSGLKTPLVYAVRGKSPPYSSIFYLQDDYIYIYKI